MKSPKRNQAAYTTWCRTKTETRKSSLILQKAEETESEPPKGAKLKGVTDNDKVQVTIGDMDKVKNEIKKLKEKKKQLEQQLKMAAGNEQKSKELEAKLAQVEAELSVKDTAEYKNNMLNIPQRNKSV